MTELAILLTALAVCAVVAAAYCVGRSAGYWKRVREEKSARGVW